MTRATVEDSTAGLGQTLRTVRPVVVGLSDHDFSGMCTGSWARRMPEALAVRQLLVAHTSVWTQRGLDCMLQHELELRDGVEIRMLPYEEKQQSDPRW